MNKCALILLLIIQSYSAFCQAQKHSYDSLVRKLADYSWWYVKRCENDMCHDGEDSAFFYADRTYEFDRKYLDLIKYKTDKYVLCVRLLEIHRIKDEIGDTMVYKAMMDEIPDFCFIDSDVVNNTYQMFTLGEDGFFKAELIFTSNNEFYVRRTDTSKNKKTEERFYFKLRGRWND